MVDPHGTQPSRPSPPDLGLRTPAEVDAAGEAGETAILRWAREYLQKPDERLPRASSVCPFVPRALQLGTLWFATHPEVTERHAARLAMTPYINHFLDLEPRDGPDARYKAIAVVFSGVAEEAATDVIDGLQAELKTGVRLKSMMIGELHPRNMTPAVGTPAPGYPAVYANRSPVPILVLRLMVEADWSRFVCQEPDPILKLRYKRAWISGCLRWEPLKNTTRATLEADLKHLDDLLTYIDANR